MKSEKICMSNKVISEKINDFINKYLNSCNEVQVIVHFYNNPYREYSLDIIAGMIASDEQVISKSLEHLSVNYLLSVRKNGNQSVYAYNYSSDKNDSVIKLISLTHKDSIKQIIEIINEKMEASANSRNH